MGIKIDGNLIIKDMVIAIENNSIKIADIAKKYDSSNRTIQIKMKKLGYVWDAKQSKYSFTGSEETLLKTMDEVFMKIERMNRKERVKMNQIKDEIASDLDDKKEINNESVKNSENTIDSDVENINVKDSRKGIDNIDRLLTGKKSKKEYRGFYLDSDVLSIIDNVDNGIKSELVNECLRKVFKEKGLL